MAKGDRVAILAYNSNIFAALRFAVALLQDNDLEGARRVIDLSGDGASNWGEDPDAVRDAAVIGKTDGVRGEVPLAFVEVNEDHTFDESALRSWCRDRLAGYKVPREIRHIDQLPRNPTGKILRRELKAHA